MTEAMPAALTMQSWPKEGIARVPYSVYLDASIYRMEQEKIFRGSTWNYVALEAELPNPGDFKTTAIGDTPVIVARDKQGATITGVSPMAVVLKSPGFGSSASRAT